ncbi:MAG: TetR/AcrR family transcriptional regulator [Clostridium sp.]|nr:TetR/AcrR family transcriptional regulator [Clostridium sp.]
MKREEKNRHSRQKIMDSAFREFGEKSYGEASLNTICRDGAISKGIIYHYFKDKDALFLACVRECFNALTVYMKENMTVEGGAIESVLNQYFDARIRFFRENPKYLKVFYSAVILPPPHLAESISAIRKDFDDLNVAVLTGLLENVPLRRDVSTEEAIEIFRLFQDLVNTRFQMESFYGVDIGEHEKLCSHILEILLYGVVERG